MKGELLIVRAHDLEDASSLQAVPARACMSCCRPKILSDFVCDLRAQAKGQGALAAKLPRSLGWSMGTEIRESHYQLTAKCAALVQPGMVFNVSLGAPGPGPLCYAPAPPLCMAALAAAHCSKVSYQHIVLCSSYAGSRASSVQDSVAKGEESHHLGLHAADGRVHHGVSARKRHAGTRMLPVQAWRTWSGRTRARGRRGATRCWWRTPTWCLNRPAARPSASRPPRRAPGTTWPTTSRWGDHGGLMFPDMKA